MSAVMDPYTQQPLPRREPTGSLSPASSPFAPSPSAHSPASPPASTHASVGGPSTSKIRRRNRQITSCLECRRRKLKCDKTSPCVNCTKFRRECIFLSKDMNPANQLKLTEIKEKVGSLERLLARDAAHSGSSLSLHAEEALADGDDADDTLPGAEDERDLEPTPLAVVDAAYDETAETDDDLLDLGIQIGRMRITERIGGFFRPKMAVEIGYSLTEDPKRPPSQEAEPLHRPGEASSTSYEYMKPGPSYIPPASGFFFGASRPSASLFDFLPSRLAADRLIKQYFVAVHPICQIVHRPTFETEYEAFWEETSLGIEPVASFQTVIFAAMFSGVISMNDDVVFRDFGVSKANLIDNFKLGTETALGRANFLRTTKIQTLQGLVMYMIPLCREEVSRAHSVLVGAAVRMAECMGIHRDGDTYGLNPLETHVRRLIWYQLCLLDLRTGEAQGPKPSIRRDDFDTRVPLNIDDKDLYSSRPTQAPADRWTDVTLTLIRFESAEMQRTIWFDRPRIERRKISLTAVLSKIETFRKNMDAKYDHILDDRIPIQRYAKILKLLLYSRLHIMLLHRYHNSVTTPMPERLRQILLTASVNLIESAIALETLTELEPWKWNVGAYHQYHAAFLMLIEVHFYSGQKEADRIWPCLDYVFQTNKSLTREEKARKILMELHEKTTMYQQRRKMRAPIAMQKHVGQQPPRKVEKDDQPVATKSPEPTGAMRTGIQSVERAAVPVVEYTGASDGDILWAAPPAARDSPSTVTSNGVNSTEVESRWEPHGAHGQLDKIMAEIDWDTFDALFPPDQMNMDWEIPRYPGTIPS